VGLGQRQRHPRRKAAEGAATSPRPSHPDQAAALVIAAWEQDVMWGTLVWLVMTTGMRRGEVLALRWRHVHFDRRLLEIRRNYVQRRGRKIEKDTKMHQMRRISLDIRGEFAGLAPDLLIPEPLSNGGQPRTTADGTTLEYSETAEPGDRWRTHRYVIPDQAQAD
jgi:integrase